MLRHRFDAALPEEGAHARLVLQVPHEIELGAEDVEVGADAGFQIKPMLVERFEAVDAAPLVDEMADRAQDRVVVLHVGDAGSIPRAPSSASARSRHRARRRCRAPWRRPFSAGRRTRRRLPENAGRKKRNSCHGPPFARSPGAPPAEGSFVHFGHLRKTHPEGRLSVHDRDVLVTASGRITMYRKNIGLSTVMAGQRPRSKEVGAPRVRFRQDCSEFRSAPYVTRTGLKAGCTALGEPTTQRI